MVKLLDDTVPSPKLIQHVGWRLWRANEHWQRAFRAEMVASGYGWFAEARANVLPYLDRSGTRQATLAARMQLSKQAIQQFIDGLVADGVVERSSDPDDARGRIVRFTKAGLDALVAANLVKRRIEADFRRRLGTTRYRQLCEALAQLDASLGQPTAE